MPDPQTPQPKTTRRRAQVYTEPKSRTTIGWDPNKLRLAERQADAGQLMLAADLVTTMLGDDRLRGVTETLSGVVSLPMKFESGARETEDDQDPAVQALGEGDWWAMLPEQTQAELVVWGRLLGFALASISEWKLDEQTGRALPVVDVWSPRWARWIDDDLEWEITTREGKVRTKGTDGTWLIFTAYRKSKGWQVAPWRGLARLWLLKQYALVDWADLGDKHAQAKRIIERKDFATWGAEGGELVFGSLSDDEADRLTREVHSLGRSGTIKLPDGYQLRLLETQGKGSEIYQQQITAANTAYAVTLLGQNLSTEVQAGAYASTTVHNLVKQDRIAAVAEWLSTATHEQLLPWWVAFNFADARTPWARYDTTPPADEKADAEKFKSVADAVNGYLTAGVALDWQEVKERFDVPLDLEAMKRSAEQSPAPPAPAATSRGRSLLAARRAVVAQAAADGNDQLDAGVDYLDALEASGAGQAVRDLRPDIDTLVGLVKRAGAEQAETDAQREAVLLRLRQAVLDAFGKMDPIRFAETVERVEMLASMAGAYSATGEV